MPLGVLSINFGILNLDDHNNNKCNQNPDETRNPGENIADNGGLKVIWIKTIHSKYFQLFSGCLPHLQKSHGLGKDAPSQKQLHF